MKRDILLCLTVLCGIINMVSANRFFYKYPDSFYGSNVEYEIIDENKKTCSVYSIVNGFTTFGTVIPEYASDGTNEYKVVAISQACCVYDTSLSSIIIPSTVTDIGPQAFYKCTNLQFVSFGNSDYNENAKMSIGSQAFAGCSKLSTLLFSVNISKKTDSFDDQYFYKIGKPQGMTNPNSIPNSYYYINFPSDSKVYNGYVFSNDLSYFYFARPDCDSEFQIPSTVETIGARAFFKCNLKKVSVPSSVTTLGSECFRACSNLKDVILEDASTPLTYQSAIFGTSPVQNLYLGRDLTNQYESLDNLVSLETGYLISYIPANVFQSVTTLKSVKINPTIRPLTIQTSAFSGCTALTELILPESINAINSKAFSGSGLRKVIIPSGSIGASSFSDCALEEITLGDQVKSIGSNAFTGNSGLKRVYSTKMIPPNATSGVFSNYNLTLGVRSEAKANYLSSSECWNKFTTITTLTDPISVTGKTVSTTKYGVGEKVKLSVILTPSTVTCPTILWASNNPEIATVDIDGLLTMHNNQNNGEECIITARTLYGDDPQIVFSVEDGLITVYNYRQMNISPSTITVTKGQSFTPELTITPHFNVDPAIEWKSDDEEICKVSSAGKITATGRGSTHVMASLRGSRAMTSVTVISAEDWEMIPGEGAQAGSEELDKETPESKTKAGGYFSDKHLLLRVGQEATLTLVPDISLTEFPELEWNLNNPQVANLIPSNDPLSMKFKGTQIGTSLFTVQIKDTQEVIYSGSITVIGEEPVKSIEISPVSLTMAVGSSIILKAIPIPETSNLSSISWTSDDTTIATLFVGSDVFSPVLYANAPGTVTITATTADGYNISGSCQITVKEIKAGDVSIDSEAILGEENIDENINSTTQKGPVLYGKDLFMRIGQKTTIKLKVNGAYDVLPDFKWSFGNTELITVENISENGSEISIEAVSQGKTEYTISYGNQTDYLYKGWIFVFPEDSGWYVTEDFTFSNSWLPSAIEIPNDEQQFKSFLTGIEYELMGCYCLNNRYLMINGKNYSGAYISFTLPEACEQIDVVTSNSCSTNNYSSILLYIDGEYVSSCRVNELSKLYEIEIPLKYRKKGSKITIKSGSNKYNQQFESFTYHMIPSIQFKKERIALYRGYNFQLEATKEDDKLVNENLTWQSSDKDIIVVDKTGTVKALKEGEAFVTVSDGKVLGLCNVRVYGFHDWILKGVENFSYGSYNDERTISQKTEDGAYIEGNNIMIRANTTSILKVELPEEVESFNQINQLQWCIGSLFGKKLDCIQSPGTFKLYFDTPGSLYYEVWEGFNTSLFSGVITVLPEKPINSILLQPEETSIELNGAPMSLNAIIDPVDASIQTLNWSSSNKNVAIVDNKGNVNTTGVGTCTIWATTTDGTNIVAYSTVNVIPVLAKEIVLCHEKLDIEIAEEHQMEVIVNPSHTTDKTIIWESTRPEIVSVSEGGKLKAITEGEATITASCGEVSATCKVTVLPVKAENIILSHEFVELESGRCHQLTATVNPSHTTHKTIVWSSSDPTVAEVDNSGLVMAKNIGITDIKAQCGEVSAICTITVSSPTIDPESIKLNIADTELNVGETFRLTATVLPENATNKSVIWKSTNEQVATVSETGLVEAISEGMTKIIASCGNVSATCDVTVVSPIINAEDIVLNNESAELNIGETLQLSAKVLPENVTNKSIIWKSTNEQVATVSETGLVEAISDGMTKIIASCGDVTATCDVTVVSPIINAEDIVLNIEYAELKVNETLQLEVSILPENVTDKTLEWSSSKPEVASISQTGLITALSNGDTEIVCSCGDISATCLITVIDATSLVDPLPNQESKISIYSTEGFLIKKHCKVEDLKKLDKGIYIIVSGKERYKIYL